MFTVKRGSGGIAGKAGAKALSKEEHNPSNDYSQNNISIPPVAFGYFWPLKSNKESVSFSILYHINNRQL